MGLNDEYDAIRNQILLMDPLPNVLEGIENSAIQAKAYQSTPRFNKIDKSHLKCDYYGKKGHVKARFFKIKGYPEWWQENKENIHKPRVNVVAYDPDGETPMDLETGLQGTNNLHDMISCLIEQEVGKMMEANTNEKEECENFNSAVEFSSISFLFRSNSTFMNKNDTWIVDSSASTHVCCNISRFDPFQIAKNYAPVHLPDNSTITVKSIGVIKWSSDLQLFDCLLVPFFKYNLLSVSKMVQTSPVKFSFFADIYLLQDSDSSKVLRVAKEAKGLYLLDSSFFF
ncbi:hypothetical protein LIER_37589 [Lithospermum erythrorhizon]|uniref:Retrovirus-related Pol polyprotein from transposon TNT 1-94-like beta-barrel domain-containing protein n=1 Tax=Lithospermum erythrorhizon TaxID=34254 RepID=A0AAV3PSL2_LITER